MSNFRRDASIPFPYACRPVAPGMKADGKDDVAVMVDVIKASDPEFKADGKSADYIRGRYAALDPIEAAKKRSDSHGSTAWRGDATTTAPVALRDDGEDDPIEAAKRRSDANGANAWRGPA